MRAAAGMRGATYASAVAVAGLALAGLAVAMSPSGAAANSISLNPTPPQAAQPTSASITPSLSPDRLGASAALTLTIQFAGGELGVPSPVRRSVLRLPAGMSLYVPSLRSCSAAHLRAHGEDGCPARSRLGAGHALVETRAGALTITENVTLRAFLGPPNNLQPTFEILAQGYSPLDESVVFGGSVHTDRAPYGEQLVMTIPPVPSLPLEPDASVVTFSLTVGASGGVSSGRQAHDHNAVLVPSSCPADGFPFAAEFTYADGSHTEAWAAIPCPR